MKKKIYSLFIGRWQPFHKGHKTLIDNVLSDGKNVLIACRDTKIGEDNPYSYQERVEMIRKIYPDENKVKIIKIPDIEEVCYGRKVGWGIREIKLAEDIENISATKIRNDNLDNRQ